MTAVARITQDEMDRALKSVKRAEVQARVVFDLKNERIEIIIGRESEGEPITPAAEEWTDDDR